MAYMQLRFTFSFILLFFVLLLVSAKTNTIYDEIEPETVKYKCPPCGCEYENFIFDLPGICPACDMPLVPIKKGLAAQLGQELAPLFYDNNLIKLYTKVLYPIFLVGIICSMIFLSRAYFKKTSNSFLLGIILVLSLYGFKSQLYGVGYQLTDNVKSLFIPISLISLLGPLIYFYLKSSMKPGFARQKTDNLHFIPALLILLLYTIGWLIPEKNSVHFMSSPFEVIISHAEQTWSAVMGLVYLFFSFKLYQKWCLETKDNHVQLKAWLKRFIIGMGLLCSFWGCLIFFNYWLYDFGVATVSNYPLWISFSIGFNLDRGRNFQKSQTNSGSQ